jgi:hypothetical protein
LRAADAQELDETTPVDPLHLQAITAWNLLANGMGGLDWSGLPIVCEYLGVHDPEALIDRLAVIRQHQRERKPDDTPNGSDDHGTGDPID